MVDLLCNNNSKINREPMALANSVLPLRATPINMKARLVDPRPLPLSKDSPQEMALMKKAMNMLKVAIQANTYKTKEWLI